MTAKIHFFYMYLPSIKIFIDKGKRIKFNGPFFKFVNKMMMPFPLKNYTFAI